MAEVSVYVMKCDHTGFVKVGFSSNPERRLKEIMFASGAIVTLEYVFKHEAADEVERAAHKLLRACRQIGEWFDVTIDQAIKAIETATLVVKGRDWFIVEPVPTIDVLLRNHRRQSRPRR